MSVVALTPGAAATSAPVTLDDALAALAKVGRPRIHCLDDGTWYCVCEMHVAASGVDFKVASDFKQTTPRAAVDQCASRVAAALRSAGR